MININGKFYEIFLCRPLIHDKYFNLKKLEKEIEHDENAIYLRSRIMFLKELVKDQRNEKREITSKDMNSDHMVMVREVGTQNWIGLIHYATSFQTEAIFDVYVDNSNKENMKNRYITTLVAENMFKTMGYLECKQWVWDDEPNIKRLLIGELNYHFVNSGEAGANNEPTGIYYKTLNHFDFDFYIL